MLVARSRGREGVATTAVLAALVFAQLAAPYWTFTPSVPVSDFYNEQRGHTALRRLTGDEYRFAATGLANFYSGSSVWLGLNDMRGLALYPPALEKLLEAAMPATFERDPLKIILYRDEWQLDSPVLDDLSVGYFALGTNEVPFGQQVADDGPWAWWAPAAAAVAMAVSATGPISGLAVPVRASGECERGSVRMELRGGAGVHATSSRPAYDIGADYLWFADPRRRAARRGQHSLITMTRPIDFVA